MKLLYADFNDVAELNKFIALLAKSDIGQQVVKSVETLHSPNTFDTFRLWYWYNEAI